MWTVTFADDGGDWEVDPVDVDLANSTSALGARASVVVTRVVRGEAAASLRCQATQVIRGLTQGMPYYVRVTAYNKAGFGLHAPALSPSGRATQAPMRVPGRVTGTALQVTGGTSLRVSWSPPNDNGGDAITEYRVDYSTSSSFAAGSVHSVSVRYLAGGAPFAASLQGLVTGQKYWVLVFAMNSQGFGEGQGPTPLFEFPRQVPKSPVNVFTEVTSPSMVTVGFDLPLDDGGDAVTSVRVEWDVDPEFESTATMPHKGSAVVATSAARAYTVTGLSAGTRYFVRVAAGNSVGFGLASIDKPAGVVPARQVPGRPTWVVVRSNTTDADVSCGGEIVVEIGSPIVPAHGIPCSGNGLATQTPGICPSGMGSGTQADGGAAIHKYEVQWSTFADFRDTTSDGGSSMLDITGASNPPFTKHLTRSSNNLQAGQLYYVRVAARNDQGIGAFCDAGGMLCDQEPLKAVPSASC